LSGVADDLSARLDDTALRVVRLAAEIGTRVSDPVYVTFSTLLLGLVHAQNPQSRQFAAILATANPATTARILSDLTIQSGGAASLEEQLPALAQEVGSMTTLDWPGDRQLLSTSASKVVNAAADATGPQPAGVRDLIAAYLDKPPSDHLDELAKWGLTPEVRVRISTALDETPPAPPNPPAGDDDLTELARSSLPPDFSPLAGRDLATSVIIRIAEAIGSALSAAGEPVVQTANLIEAVISAQPIVAGRSSEVAAVLSFAIKPRAGAEPRPGGVVHDSSSLASALGKPGLAASAFSDNAGAAMQAAEAIARFTAGRSGDTARPMGVRHLVAGLLSTPQGVSRARTGQILLALGVDLVSVRHHLLRVISERYPEDDRQKWRELLVGGSITRIATLRSDSVPEDPRSLDQLDLRRYADAFGALIAAETLAPPLSIAVFGPWGSGKSFFMKMIQAATREFAGSSAQAPAGSRMFKRRIVPIWFNAWNYADGNLWASLVYTILFKLHEALEPPQGQPHPFAQALAELDIAKAARVEAQSNLERAERKHAEALAALSEAEKAANERQVKEDQVRGRDVLVEIRAMVFRKLAPADPKKSAAWIETVGRSVEDAATYLGRPDLAQQVPALTDAAKNSAAALEQKVGDIEELLREAQAAGARGRSMLGWLANVKVGAGDWAALVGVMVAILAIAGGLAVLLGWVLPAAATIGDITAAIAPLLGAAGLLTAWAKRHVGTANRALATLEALRTRVEETKQQRLSQVNAEFEAARRATNEAEAEVARRRADGQAAQAAVDAAKNELRASTQPELMRRFVSQRLVDGEYERHLGLLHTVRKDMDRLGEILRNVHPQEEEARGQAPIERIVLYIDDLDRCPPEQVVEVLEAVHLLLAIPLFIVVVGVDIRWVSQALVERYPHQLGPEAGVASPTDYLEKVFQVPFGLPPMDGETARKLLLSEMDVASAPPTLRRQDKPDDRAGNGGTAGATPPDDRAAPAGAAPGGLPRQEPPRQPSPPPPPPAITAAEAAEALSFLPTEQDRVVAMASAIGASPRRAKRFVNLYRLMKASLSADERIGFVTEEGAGGSFVVATILLAMTTGAPTASRELIGRLADSGKDEVREMLARGLAVPSASVPQAERIAFAAAIDLINQLARQPTFASDLHDWAGRVRRFVFDSR
jgi:hypothetical protein